MLARFPREKYLQIAVFAVIALMAALQCWARRGFYGDGVWVLLYVLDHRGFFTTNDPTRLFQYWFTQFPTVAVVRLGMRDLPFLAYLFSSWVIVSPLIFWCGALWKLRDDLLFWPFVALFTIIYFNSSFLIVAEYNLAYALSAFCLAMLLRTRTLNGFDLAWLIFAAVVLVECYPSTMFMGPLLAMLVFRNLTCASGEGMKFYWVIVACLLIGGAFIGWWSYHFPIFLPGKNQAMGYSIWGNKQLLFTLGCAVLAVMPYAARAKIWRDAIMLCTLIVIFISMFGFFRPTPIMTFFSRANVGIALFGASVVLTGWNLFARRWSSDFGRERFDALSPHYFALPVFALFIGLAVLDMADSVAYRGYIQGFADLVNTRTGFVENIDLAETLPDDRFFGWVWTYPPMSLLLRHNTQGAIVLNAPMGIPFEKFDPRTALPDLSDYYQYTQIR